MSLFRCEQLYGEIEMRKKRVIFCMILIIVLFGILALRMVDLQVLGGELMEKAARELGSRSETVSAVRGEILDRNSEVLITNESAFYLTVYPSADDETVAKVSKIINKQITKDDSSDGQPFIFAANIEKGQAAAIMEQGFSGVEVRDSYVRKALGVKLSHVAGTVGSITEEEYTGGEYKLSDKIGKSGIEKFAERYLKGTDGERTTDFDGKITEKAAKDGCYTELCIDKKLQKKCEDELKRAVDEVNKTKKTDGGGAAVVIDVKNGDVLAMCSYPDYNIEDYAENYDTLLADKRNPLLDRCISGKYEPGSVYKPSVALAALSEGAVTADEKIEDKGVYKYYAPSYTPSCYIWTNKHITHGRVNVSEALSVSCNYYFYEAGRRLGIEKMAEYGRDFGLGELCGIELEGEGQGVVASPATKKDWVAGDTLQAAIGQSVNMFTPLSLARYTAAIANGGYVYKPHIVKKIAEYGGKTEYERKTELVRTVKLKKEYYDAVREGMKLCCESGTAAEEFSGKNFSAGGKTGTAQVPEGPDNGLFIGFAPFENPEIAVCVVIEHGSGTHAPRAASEIMSEWIVNSGNR